MRDHDHSHPPTPTNTRRSKRASRTTPRAMPPMRNRDRHDIGVAPLSALNPETVYSANEWIAGLAGGSVGVLGTLIQLELKQVTTEGMHALGSWGRSQKKWPQPSGSLFDVCPFWLRCACGACGGKILTFFMATCDRMACGGCTINNSSQWINIFSPASRKRKSAAVHAHDAMFMTRSWWLFVG